MSEANGVLVAEVVAKQLEALLEVGNYDGAKLLLQPVQEVDTAEAIGSLPRTLQALAFRLLPKNEAIEVYEYLDASVQQSDGFRRAISITNRLSRLAGISLPCKDDRAANER